MNLRVGMHVYVDMAGLQASNAGASVSFGGGAEISGVIVGIDMTGRQIMVKLNAVIAGHDTIMVGPERIRPLAA